LKRMKFHYTRFIVLISGVTISKVNTKRGGDDNGKVTS